MSYDKGNWKQYGNNLSDLIVDIKIKDASGMQVGHFVSFSKKQYQQILRNIEDKFSLTYPRESRTPITMTAAVMKMDLELPKEKSANEIIEEMEKFIK